MSKYRKYPPPFGREEDCVCSDAWRSTRPRNHADYCQAAFEADRDWFARQAKRSAEDVKQLPNWLRSSRYDKPVTAQPKRSAGLAMALRLEDPTLTTRIHVRRDLVHKDKKTGKRSAVFGVESAGHKKRYGRSVTIEGPSRMVYRPDKPLKCGARAWIETEAPVKVHR